MSAVQYSPHVEAVVFLTVGAEITNCLLGVSWGVWLNPMQGCTQAARSGSLGK